MSETVMPKEAILGGILYAVKIHEGLIVFEESICIYGFHSRLIFQREDFNVENIGCWTFQFSTYAGWVSPSRIGEAYALIKSVYGDNFNIKQPV